MVVRLGTISDLSMILDTVASCVADLRNQGILQWDEHYPSEDILRADILSNNLHLAMEAGRCAALGVLDERQEAEWGSVEWSGNLSRPLMVHRLMVHPWYQKKGIGRMMMDYALGHAARGVYDHIRFDVYSGNPRLIETYERMGCVRRGEVRFPGRELPFYCYEKALS